MSSYNRLPRIGEIKEEVMLPKKAKSFEELHDDAYLAYELGEVTYAQFINYINSLPLDFDVSPVVMTVEG